VPADPSDVAVQDLDLARMDGGAQMESELRHRFHEREGASEGPRRRIERRKDAVARRLDETAMKALDLVPRRLVVSIDDLAPIALPTAAARPVESTMSVNRTMASTRSTFSAASSDRICSLVHANASISLELIQPERVLAEA
jgi:hypothetical protein